MVSTIPVDFCGTIVNFSSAHISNDGIQYLEFALRLPPPPDPPNPPVEKVLYLDLSKSFAPAAALSVVFAWANRTKVDVFLDRSISQEYRVRAVVPA
jgi:hypothetical protein